MNASHPKVTILSFSLLAMVLFAITATAQDPASGSRSMKAVLSGFEEVPAIFSEGSGSFRARVANDDGSIEYELSYENVGGTTTTGAHIHLGQRGVNGGVVVFLCGGAGKPDCPPISGAVKGVLVPEDVLGPAGQGIAAGEFHKLLAAMRSGVAYVNVHTDVYPAGEIRGQIR